jgi:hypothetical protein
MEPLEFRITFSQLTGQRLKILRLFTGTVFCSIIRVIENHEDAQKQWFIDHFFHSLFDHHSWTGYNGIKAAQ